MTTRAAFTFAGLAFAALATLACKSTYSPPPVSERPPSLFDTVVDVPRDRMVSVGIAFHEATLKTVESQLEPTAETVAKAKAKHPDRKRLVLLRFRYDNPGWASRKISLRTTLLAENGAVLAEGGRSSSLDAREANDTITVPLSIRTADWGEARRLRVTAAFIE